MTDPETEVTDPVVLADRSWIEVQQNTFTNWCNDRLKGSGELVQDLVTDLDDGVKLIVLLKRISFKRVCAKYYEKPRLPVHRSENLEKAFRFMTEEEKLHLVNIGPQDVIQHNQKIILGLIWHLILRYQIFGGQTTAEQVESKKKTPRRKPPAKKVLLKWLQSEMPPSLPVTNLSSDWNDGKHLSALVDSMKPGLIPDYESQVPSDALRNTQNAMDVAEEEFGIPKVIKPEHLCVEQPDELSVMTYLSYFCSGYDSPGHSSLLAWVREKIPEYNIQNFTTDWSDGKALSALVNVLADGSMPHHAELDPEKGIENVRNAMKTAEENLEGIPASVSPEDFATDSLTMMGYIGSFRKATLKRDMTMTSPDMTGEDTPATVTVHVTSHAIPLSSSSGSEAPTSPFTTEIAVKGSPPPRSPSPVQEVEYSSVVEAAQPIWPEDMSHTVQNPPDEDVDTSASWGDIGGKPQVDARQQAVVKVEELHKRFQEIVQWEAGKDFDKEEKKKIVDEADAEYKAFENDPVTKFSVPPELAEQRKEAMKHWQHLCSMVDAEVQAEQTLQELRNLNTWVKGCLSDLDSQPPLADSLEGVKKQKEWHQMFMSKFSAKHPEIQKHASLSVTTYTEGLLDVIKEEHAILGKGRSQLMKKWQEWGKLLDACVAAWEKCISAKDKLRQLEEQHAKWGPPAENRDILEQFRDLQTFQTSRVVPLKSEVSAMTDLVADLKSLGGHPPVEELCRSVSERYDWLVSSLDVKYTATQECCRMAREFEQLKQPFEAWVTKTVSDVNGLLRQASDSRRLVTAKEKLEAIQKAAMAKEKDVSALSQLSLKFSKSREPVLGEISEYHNKLQSITPSPVSVAAMKEGTTKKQSATPSIDLQTSNLEKKWEWVLDQSIALPPCYPEKVVLEGIPQGVLTVGQQYRLEADTSNAGDWPVRAELSGPTKHEPCTVEEAPNKTFHIFFTPEEVGKHKVDIVFADTAIPLSPLVFGVVDPTLVKVTPPSPNEWGVFTTHEPCTFHIKCPSRTEQITATAQGRQNAKEFGIPVQDLGGGEYNAILITPTPDKYEVKFYYSGHLVPSSPYLLPVEEKANPDLVTCTMYVSPTDDKICVEADTSRAGTGKLSATAQGDKVGTAACKVEDEGAGKWVVSVNPPMPDVYTVHVYWNDMDVPHSPFTTSTIRVDASKIRVEGPHLNETPVLAICETSDAGEGTLSAKCTSNRFGDVPVHVASAEDHKQSVLFTPPGKDQFSLSILWNGVHVPGSPFHINLAHPDASMAKVDGPHPSVEGTGPVRTFIDTSEAGEGTLSAKCTSSRFGDVPVHVAPVEDHKQGILFTPPGKDHFSLSVFWDEIHVPGSPFHINLAHPDASMAKVDGPHPSVEGIGPVRTFVDTSEAGEGTLSAKCTSSRFGDVPVHVAPVEDHKQGILFTPPGKDHFSLSVLWDGMHVPGSPFHVNLAHPDASKVKVDGPHPSVEGTGPVRTFIDTSEAGDGDLQVECMESGGPVQVTLTEGQRSHYTAVFEASNSGTYKVDVTFSGEPVPDSPFSVPVVRSVDEITVPVIVKEEVEEEYETEQAEVVEASYIPEGFAELYDEEEGSKENADASPESYPVFVPGTPLCITVEREDKEVSTSVKAKCTGERVGKIASKVTTNSDGEHLVSINPRHADLYTLEIKVGKEHIPGSPFIVRYAYPPPVASKCKVHGLPSEEDKWLTREEIVYYVDATEAGYGELTIECEGPSVATQPSQVKITPPSESEASYKVVYMPTAPGVHKHNIFWSKESVPGSPFTFIVEQHSRPLYNWGPVSLSLTLASSIPKNISGHVVHQTSKKKLRLRVKEDPVFAGTYHCTFVPKSAGVHEVYITSQKKPVEGSPFEVIVLEAPQARKVVVKGLDNVRCAVDKPLRFTVDCTDAGSGDLQVRNEGPSDPSRKPQLELVDNKDNTFSCMFVPTAIGTHQIYMQWGGEPVRKTPFLIEAVSSIRFELGDVELGQPLQVGVFDDPNDKLSAVAVGERTGDAPVVVIQDELNRKSVLFTPLFGDDYTLSIFVNGSHVEGSPYCIRVPAAVLEPVYTKEPTPEDVVVKEERYILPELATSPVLQMASPDEEGLGVLSFHQASTPGNGDRSKLYIIPDDLDALSKPIEMNQLCTFHVNTFGAGPGTLEVIARGPAKTTITIEESEKYGVQRVQCAPSKPGEYRLEVQWNDTPLEESPLIVNFHHELVKTGLDLSVVPFYIGRPYKFKTLCEEVGEGELIVDVDPPLAATVNVRDLGTDAYLTTITPHLEGQHKISVTHGEQHLFGSPFSVTFMQCGDASKCCLVEEDQAMGDGKVCFMVDTKGAGAGELTADVLCMQDQLHIPCEVKAVRDTSYWICFETKQDVTEYLVSIKYDGAHIPRSPFQLVLSSQPTASVCRVEGDGLRFAEVNKESQFVVFTDCTDADVKVKIEGISERVFPSLRQLEDGVYEYTYTAQFEGEYQIDVFYNGEHIPGSPFMATAHHPSTLPKIVVDRNSIQHVVCGCPLSFDIRAIDVPSDAALTVTAYIHHEAVTGKIDFKEEGLFRGTLDPPKSGNYIVHSCWEGKDVLGSPFHVRVSDPPVPDNVKASGSGLQEGVAGHTCDFTVDTMGAGAATLVVAVMGPNGPVRANIKRIPKEKRLVDAGFLPLHPGEYTVEVLWADKHIHGSPFKMHVSPYRREQSV